jgi:hypothetical protein
MIPYYWIQEETPEVVKTAHTGGVATSMWFPAGYMRDPDCWMYNHKKPPDPSNPYPAYRPDRKIQEIDEEKLFAAADKRIQLSGWQGPTWRYDGYICPNYEDYTCITHPGPTQNLPQEESFLNHAWLVDLMKGRYPDCKVANWGLPQYATPWGDYDILGYQMLGQLTWMHDYGAVSVYQLGRDNDLEFTQDRLNWYARWSMPLVVYMNAWEMHRTVHGGDGKWHPQSDDKRQQIFDMIAATPNVVGVEMWSMVQHDYIEKGRMGPETTSIEQIDARHVESVRFIGQAV